MIESVFRFKGQSTPAVILSEIDFELIDEQHVRRRLFVGFTRAAVALSLVVAEHTAQIIGNAISN